MIFCRMMPHGLALAALFMTLSCAETPSQTPSQAPPPADPNVLAIYDGGEVTRDDLDKMILELPQDKRALADKDAATWYRQLVRELSVDRLLIEEARTNALTQDPLIAKELAEAHRQFILNAFLRRNAPAQEPISEAQLRQRYADSGERFNLPAARRVRHLFLRQKPGQTIDDLRQKMTGLRARLVAGESFQGLAAENSDSESRHHGGDLGMLRQGSLPKQLERVIFSLPLDVPSTPITAAGGVHMFLVEKAQPAREFTFEEVGALLQREAAMERRGKVIETLVDESVPQSKVDVNDSVVTNPQQLADLLQADDLNAVVLRLGDFSETLGGLLQRLGTGQGPAPEGQLLARFVRQLEQREHIYQQNRNADWINEPELSEQWRRRQERLLVNEQRQRRLEQALDRQPETLRRYYEDNALRFSSPLLQRLKVLRVPLADPAAANQAMARLEALVSEPKTDLQTAADQLGGNIEELDWLPFPLFAQAFPDAAPLVADLQKGQRSAPFRGDQHLVLLEVLDRREPEPEPFANVLDRVRAAYIETHGQEFYRSWSDQQLTEAGWRLFDERLDQLVNQPQDPE